MNWMAWVVLFLKFIWPQAKIKIRLVYGFLTDPIFSANSKKKFCIWILKVINSSFKVILYKKKIKNNQSKHSDDSHLT